MYRVQASVKRHLDRLKIGLYRIFVLVLVIEYSIFRAWVVASHPGTSKVELL